MIKTSQRHTFPAFGVVVENLPGARFRVRIDRADSHPGLVSQDVLCTLAGKMRMNWVRLLPGDAVALEVSVLDPTKGRITYKLK